MKLFVYGTLRKSIYNHDIYLSGENEFCGYAYVLGTLYTIIGQDYPALILEGNASILGEIYDVSEELLKEIDELEEFISEGHEKNEYDRVFCDVYDENGQFIDRMFVYVYNTRRPENRALLGNVIECNDYVEYYNGKREWFEIEEHLIS